MVNYPHSVCTAGTAVLLLYQVQQDGCCCCMHTYAIISEETHFLQTEVRPKHTDIDCIQARCGGFQVPVGTYVKQASLLLPPLFFFFISLFFPWPVSKARSLDSEITTHTDGAVLMVLFTDGAISFSLSVQKTSIVIR